MISGRERALSVSVLVAALGAGLGAVACSDDASSLTSGASSSGGSSGESSGDVGDGTDGGGSSTSSTSSSSSSSGGADGGSSSSGGATTGANGNCTIPNQAHKTGLTTGLVHASGLSFSIYAPASYDKNVGHTVVVLMHGQDSNGVPELNALWKPIADTEQLVLIAPKGSRAATNNDPNGANWAVADLDKVLAIKATVDGCYNVFAKKHILWGFSEGGFYGYLLGVGAAEEFSGLAMGGANTSFARQNGYPPSTAPWKIPVSHVHGKTDFNPISVTYQDKKDFEAAGHVFTLHEFDQGHTITPAQVRMQYDDLKASNAP